MADLTKINLVETEYDALVFTKDRYNKYQYNILKFTKPPEKYVYNEELRGYKYRIINYTEDRANSTYRTDVFDAILTSPLHIMKNYVVRGMEGMFIKLSDKIKDNWDSYYMKLFYVDRILFIKNINKMIANGEVTIV